MNQPPLQSRIMRQTLPHLASFAAPNLNCKARSERRSIHAPNLTNELSTVVERRLNQLGSAV